MQVAHEQDILKHEEGRFALSRLYELGGKTGVFPRFYELKGVESGAQSESGGSYSDFFTGLYGPRKLGIKVIRVAKEDKEKLMKVRWF